MTASRTRRRAPVSWHIGGSGDEAVLLINGWTASGLVWPRAWVSRLEDRFRVIRVDNRGSGWSREARRPFTVAEMADDARAVLATVGVDSARVLGLSMGGMIAQELAIRHPGQVNRLVLAGTRPPTPTAVFEGTGFLRESMRPLARDESRTEYFQAIWSRFAAPGFAEAHPEVLAEIVAQIARRPTPRSSVMDQVRAMLAWHGAQRLTTITAPTAIFHGELDPLIPMENGQRIADLVPRASFTELPGVGHLVPHEAGDILAEALECAELRNCEPSTGVR